MKVIRDRDKDLLAAAFAHGFDSSKADLDYYRIIDGLDHALFIFKSLPAKSETKEATQEVVDAVAARIAKFRRIKPPAIRDEHRPEKPPRRVAKPLDIDLGDLGLA